MKMYFLQGSENTVQSLYDDVLVFKMFWKILSCLDGNSTNLPNTRIQTNHFSPLKPEGDEGRGELPAAGRGGAGRVS